MTPRSLTSDAAKVRRLPERERQRIEREIRHAWNTVWPPGDSWIRGYAEDCTLLLKEIDRLRSGAR